jgi:phenylpropionate dioxygenase-like ring-hydroxylating dioxygenase large terminal subunit
MLTCAYHGWTYDLANGELVAALTDGPESPICGKASVRVRSYPVEERAGLVWVYVGEEVPPPVEADIPDELLRPNVIVEAFIQLRRGNWRYAAENGIDEGHARYLHRSALWTFFRQMPAWTKGVRMVPDEGGTWLWRERGEAIFEDAYPRIGRWPPRQRRRYRNAKSVYHQLGIRLPAILMNGQTGWTDYEMWVPVDEHRHLALLLAVTEKRGLDAIKFRLWYRLWMRWAYRHQFNGQDQWMIELMNIPPERLYRPDVSVTGWRSFVEENARWGGNAGSATSGGTTNGASARPAPTPNAVAVELLT